MSKLSSWPRWLQVCLGVAVGFFLELLVAFCVWSRRDWQTVILLQNADEVRATGGFLGSLLWVTSRGFQIREYQFLDVYEVDAQIPTFPPAPAAVRRYLSGGRDALHLQDANWERDFAVSAAQISTLWQSAGRPAPDLIIAVNSTLVERLLAYLETSQPDYDLTDEHGTLITSDNFTKLARQDHKLTAFPRLPKTRFLRFFADKLTIYSQHLPFSHQVAISRLLWTAKNDRLWQAYSPHASIETFFVRNSADGRIHQEKKCHNFYPVFSNVGINKADHLTTLAWSEPEITQDDAGRYQARYHLRVTNDNPYEPEALVTDRQIWANYFRLLLPPDVAIGELAWDGVPVDSLDFRPINDSYQGRWYEWGTLLVAGEQTTHELTFTLSGDGSCWQREL